MKPLISVRVMIYRNFENAERAVRSIAMQDYPRIEVILSDDCSDNLSLQDMQQLADKYRDKFENIIVNRNPQNYGTVKHENIVNGLSSGDIFCELGSDDLFYGKDTLSRAVEFFEKTDYLIFTSKRLREVGNKRITVLPLPTVCKMIEYDQEKLRKLTFRRYNYVSMMGTFYKREVFEKNGGFVEDFRLIEDFSLYVKFMLNKEPIGFCDMVSCVHTGGGVSGRLFSNPVLREDNKNINDILLYKSRDKLDWYTRRLVMTKYNLSRNKSILYRIMHFDVLLYMIYVKGLKAVRTIVIQLLSKSSEKYGVEW